MIDDRRDHLRIGPWRATRSTNRLERPGEVREVEPKVMDLLFLLGERPGVVLSRGQIMRTLWSGVTVSDDALARCVFKLRRALDDGAGPSLIETVPKRGYRIRSDAADRSALRRTLPTSWLGLAAAGLAAALCLTMTGSTAKDGRQTHAQSEARRLAARADDHYFQYTRRDNEAATILYQRALGLDEGAAPAMIGMANVLVQRVIRWPDDQDQASVSRANLKTALQTGQTRTPQSAARLALAVEMAKAALKSQPADPWALKSYGLALSAQGRLGEAEAVYRRALSIAPSNWGVLINLGDVLDIGGRENDALAYLERAYWAMGQAYDEHAVQVRPWQPSLGVEIAKRHAAAGRVDVARDWYLKVLADWPLDPDATDGLARLGDHA